MIGRTGLFQGLSCPHFATGTCDRPYCHFKHVKREAQATSADQGYKASFSAFPIAKTDETPSNVVISQVESESPPGDDSGQSYRGSFFEPLPNPAGIPRPSLLGAGPPAGQVSLPSKQAVSTPPENEIAKSLEAVNQAIMQLQKTMQNVSGTSAMPPDSTNAVVNVIKQVQNNLIKGVKQIPSANGTKFAAPAAGSWRKLPSSSGESKANSSCPYRPTPIDQLGKTKEKAETAGTTEEYTPEAKPLKQQSKPLSTLKTGAAGLKQKADSSTDVTKKSPTTTTTARLTTKPPGKTEVGVKRSFNPEKDSVPPKRKIAEMQKNDRVIDTLRADLLTKAVKQQSKGSGLLTKSKVASTDASLRPPVSQPISSSQSIIDMSDIFGEDSDAEVKEDPVRSQAQKPNKIDSKLKNTAINRSKSSGTLVNKTKPAGIGTAKVPISKPNPLLNGFALTSPTAELDMDSLMDDNNFQFGLDEDLPKTPSPDLDETISSTTSTMPIRVSGDKTTGKIRVAYKSAANDTACQKRAELTSRPHIPSAAEVMYKRNIEMMNRKSEIRKSSSSVESPPSAEQLYGPTKKLKATGSYGFASTSSGMGEIHRTAHTPRAQTNASLKRPVIPLDFGAKIPSSLRQRYLSLMIDECLRFCKNESEAYEKGLAEEKSVYNKSSSKSVYLNSAVMTIKRLRDQNGLGSPIFEYADAAGLEPKQILNEHKQKGSVSHDAMIGVKPGCQQNFTVGLNRNRPKPKVIQAVPKERYYEALKPYLLTKAQMIENGYPVPDPDSPGKATILNDDAAKILSGNNPHRVCCRCGKQFTVDEDGFCTTYEECTFHWGRAYKRKVIGSIDARYSCCQGILGSEGCSVWKFHVTDAIFTSSLEGYLGTVPPDEPPTDGNFGVFALDCEMVYTTAGVELAKVTVINEQGEIAYETIVRPYNAILDCNTRFSGLKQEDIDKTKTRLEDVQCHLLSLFNSETLLIGHSLESDLKALKLFHTNIIDTAIVFPHKLGPPYKRALRNLALEYLQKIIQDDVGGHDSCEDARTCLELMKLRLREDLAKTKYPIV